MNLIGGVTTIGNTHMLKGLLIWIGRRENRGTCGSPKGGYFEHSDNFDNKINKKKIMCKFVGRFTLAATTRGFCGWKLVFPVHSLFTIWSMLEMCILKPCCSNRVTHSMRKSMVFGIMHELDVWMSWENVVVPSRTRLPNKLHVQGLRVSSFPVEDVVPNNWRHMENWLWNK